MGMVLHVSWFRCFWCCFLLKEHPSVSPAFPPVSWWRTVEQPPHNYHLCIASDSGDFIASWAFHIHEVGIGFCIRWFFLCFLFSSAEEWRRSLVRGCEGLLSKYTPKPCYDCCQLQNSGWWKSCVCKSLEWEALLCVKMLFAMENLIVKNSALRDMMSKLQFYS